VTPFSHAIRFYTGTVIRALFPGLLLIIGLLTQLSSAQQSTKPPDTKPPDSKSTDTKPVGGKQVEEPPEEDEALIPKTCVLNPLEADKNVKTGGFYFDKKKYHAAVNRYKEAICWDPSLAEAFLKLGEAEEKLHNRDDARDAYEKYLTLAPDAKNATEIKKRLAKLPAAK
jgi:tetratricopeptide (TPR) repeat protein